MDFILFIWRWLITFYHVRSGMTKNGLKKKTDTPTIGHERTFQHPHVYFWKIMGMYTFRHSTLSHLVSKEIWLFISLEQKKNPVIPWLRTSAFHASQHIKTRRKSFIGLALTRRKEVEIYEKRKERPCLSKVDRIFVSPPPFCMLFPKLRLGNHESCWVDWPTTSYIK